MSGPVLCVLSVSEVSVLVSELSEGLYSGSDSSSSMSIGVDISPIIWSHVTSSGPSCAGLVSSPESLSGSDRSASLLVHVLSNAFCQSSSVSSSVWTSLIAFWAVGFWIESFL